MSQVCEHGINKNNMSCWTCSLKKEYIDPEKLNVEYKKIDESTTAENSFMKRSLDTYSFITENNSKNIWENPL